MKERPILMSAPMARAILAGTKTVTRRIMKLTADTVDVTVDPGGSIFGPGPYVKARREPTDDNDATMHPRIRCPFGYPGDRLWVRETTRMRYLPNIITGEPTSAECGEYVADGEPVLDTNEFDLSWWYSRKTCPGIHMPRWASRITLEVVSVRVQRLHEITEEDAKREGVEPRVTTTKVYPSRQAADVEHRSYRGGFEDLWGVINGADSWRANPFVWRVEFKRLGAASA